MRETRNEILQEIKYKVIKENRTKYEKLKKKLINLNNGYNNSNQIKCFHERIVNLAEIDINNQEYELLSKGLKHNIQNTNIEKDIEQNLIDVENAISLVRKEDQVHARHLAAEIIKENIKQRIKNKSVESKVAAIYLYRYTNKKYKSI